MTDLELAVAMKRVEAENAALKAIVAELHDAKRYRQERELVDKAKAEISTWLKALSGVLLVLLGVLGYASYSQARNGLISNFREQSQPVLEAEFRTTILPSLQTSLQTEGAKKVDEFTSITTKQLHDQANAVFTEISALAKVSGRQPPARQVDSDSSRRPEAGFVLSSFLDKSQNDTYIINTYRLNIRDQPNGSIIGRQVQGARVKITETRGEWVRVELVK